MAKRNVFVLKEDKEIVEGVFLCKGDMLIESGKGRWTIIEAEGDEEDKDEDDKKEESDDGDEDGKEDKKEESEEDDDKMAKLRAKKDERAKRK